MRTKILNVAEKNDAAKTISQILSRGRSNRRDGYSKFNKIYSFDYDNYRGAGRSVEMVFTSVSGHLLNLAFPADYKIWERVNPLRLFEAPLSKIVTDNGAAIKRTLEREARACSELIIWTDCDREGENIGYEVLDVCKAVNPRLAIFRAKFSDMTAGSIHRAMGSLGPPNALLSEAVDCRQELDLRIGAAFTRFQTLRLQKAFPQDLSDKMISYGSCQFPTLGFVVERYKAIQEFVAEPFWRLAAQHTRDGLRTEFIWERGRLFEKLPVEVLLDRCRDQNARVTSVESKPKSKWRPVALETVELEKLSSRKLRINAQTTMGIAEKLYQKGYISYPRTETNKFPPDLNLTRLVEMQRAGNQWGDFARRVLERGPNPRNGSKSDQAHPPIHPTQFVNSLTGDDAKVYELIVRHFLACVSWNAEGFETAVKIEIADEKFKATGLLVTDRGFLEVYPYMSWADRAIANYSMGEVFRPDRISMEEGSTQAPKLLTEADLIALMEKHGIGTDATHAEHIEKIKSRLYVGLTRDQRFMPGFLGLGLVDGYDSMGPWHMSKPVLRSELEADLQRICAGERTRAEVLREQIAKYKRIFEIALQKATSLDEALSQYFGAARPVPTAAPGQGDDLANLANFVTKCAACSMGMALKERRDHAQGGAKFYVGCMNFPACKESIWLPTGVISAEVLPDLCTTPACAARDTHLLKFTLRPSAFTVPVPSSYRGCILCDPDIHLWFEIDPSRSRRPPDRPLAPPVRNPARPAAVVRPNPIAGRPELDSTNREPATRPTNREPAARPTPAVKPRPVNGLRTSYQSDLSSIWNDRQPRGQAPGPSRTEPTFGSGSADGGIIDLLDIPDTDDTALRCTCGDEAASFTCSNNGPNHGRQFSKCLKNVCGFFKWSDDQGPPQTPLRRPLGGDSFFATPGPGPSRSPGPEGDGAVVCNCGIDAKLLTVRKEGPNTGRTFYACAKGPAGQGCGFFSWADEGTSNPTPRSGPGPSGFSTPSFGGMSFPGGAGANTCNCGESAVRKTVKTGKNVGRPFFACSKGRDAGCGYFEWDDQGAPPSKRKAPGGGRGGATPGKRKCSYCKTEGHTIRTCPSRMDTEDP